jgi:hypothetical protein
VFNNQVVLRDPSGLRTIGLGVSGELYLGILHFQVNVDITFGWSWQKGFSGGMTFTGGAQFGVGLGGGVSPYVTVTTAESVADLSGWTAYIGFSSRYCGFDYLIEDPQPPRQAPPPYEGFTITPPNPYTTVGGGMHVGDLRTWVWQWF